jgi:alpha/beta superfamily hydrolase
LKVLSKTPLIEQWEMGNYNFGSRIGVFRITKMKATYLAISPVPVPSLSTYVTFPSPLPSKTFSSSKCCKHIIANK